jgi:predicted ferric reductase
MDEKRIDSYASGSYQRDADLKDVELGIDRVNTLDTIPDTRGSREARHTFLIRPRGGFTQRLRNKQSQQFHILLEGPYGTELGMYQYASVVMIVGGSGITAAISRAYALLRCGSPRSVRLIWAAQKQGLVDDVCAHELSGILGKSRFAMDVFVTSAGPKKSGDRDMPYRLRTGRPDVNGILEEERTKCAGSMAVFCCGPPGLDVSVRNAVRRLLGEEGPHVALLEERFSW